MREYTTERGVTIEVMPIPTLLDAIRSGHKMPPAPTYTEHLAGGATQDIEITPEMARAWQAEDLDGWAPYAAAWSAYEAQLDERTKILNDRLWRAVMRRSVMFDMPKDEAWVQEQRDLGIDVPDGLAERRDHYLLTEVIGSAHDIINIMALAAGANVTEEQLSAVEASFWDTIQRPAPGRLASP